ncbi:LamG-like jellyroll fold domain-containing protein [Flavilitoribacter nigricans]|nr:LamG-like jellyroll fold domain-containing protein [Flavilitoribacter nigricans]
MLKKIMTLLFLAFSGMILSPINAQIAGSSDNLQVQPIPDRSVLFDISDPGISKTVKFGADLAWANEQNFRRVIRFMGHDQLDVVRASFQPTHPLIGGFLSQKQLDDLNWRLYLIDTYAGPNTALALNCDHPRVDDWFFGHPERWEQLIERTTKRYQDAGHKVISVAPFNEPDFGWGQGSNQDMFDITALLNSNPLFDSIRLSGGNTLNCDEALGWYGYLVPAGCNEGNTHQLAGSFSNFATFFEVVRANGHHATDDELHNVVEALVGYEYGMQTGIWWGPAELARGAMVKAFDGQRIAYAEHRPNWTAAAVYRTPEGKIQAFGGTSERQAVTTSYNYISRDRAVYYDGHGPQREFFLEMPGGTGYAQGQTNAERVVNITWGDDIQPVINGRYVLVNRSSGKVMELNGDVNANGTNVQQGNHTGTDTQLWDVTPVSARIGGDFSYHHIKPAANANMSLDLYNFSLDNGANLNQWTTGNGGNQQWYLDYAEDGWFYIRSRESSYCVSLAADGTNIVQWEKTGNTDQQWRLLPAGTPIEFDAPAAPLDLVATSKAVSVRLDWTASPEADVAGYYVYRATAPEGPYNTIARNVTTTAFVDNTTLTGIPYYYAIKAADHSLNRSEYSTQVTATVTGAQTLVAHYQFEETLIDSTQNLNHSAAYGTPSFTWGRVGNCALSLNGTDDFLQLPADIASHQEITIATWVNWDGGAAQQRIFDFGNSTSQSLFLTPSNQNGQLQFGITDGVTEQTLSAPALASGQWTHVAVTLSSAGAQLYIDGQELNPSAIAPISPLDLRPVLNYIGRSQNPQHPLFNGTIDDFRIYNYALSLSEISELASQVVGVANTNQHFGKVKLFPNPTSDFLHISLDDPTQDAELFLSDAMGRVLLQQQLSGSRGTLDLKGLPAGVYWVRMIDRDGVSGVWRVVRE